MKKFTCLTRSSILWNNKCDIVPGSIDSQHEPEDEAEPIMLALFILIFGGLGITNQIVHF